MGTSSTQCQMNPGHRPAAPGEFQAAMRLTVVTLKATCPVRSGQLLAPR